MNEGLWNECVRFHGHACPGLAMGYRAAEVGMRELGIPLERAMDEEIVCISENDACGVDAIQCLISCTVGKGNMILKPSGKMAFSFFDRGSDRGVRVITLPMDRSGDRDKAMHRILNGPVDEIFKISTPRFSIPEKARMFDSIQCDICGEFCREDKIRMMLGKRHCIDCFNPYDRG